RVDLLLDRSGVGADHGHRGVSARGGAAGADAGLIGVPDDSDKPADRDQRDEVAQQPARRRGLVLVLALDGLGQRDLSIVPVAHRSSSTGVTPIIARPEAISNCTARTSARRARVSSASPSTMNRKLVSSLPLFHSAWKSEATS